MRPEGVTATPSRVCRQRHGARVTVSRHAHGHAAYEHDRTRGAGAPLAPTSNAPDVKAAQKNLCKTNVTDETILVRRWQHQCHRAGPTYCCSPRPALETVSASRSPDRGRGVEALQGKQLVVGRVLGVHVMAHGDVAVGCAVVVLPHTHGVCA